MSHTYDVYRILRKRIRITSMGHPKTLPGKEALGCMRIAIDMHHASGQQAAYQKAVTDVAEGLSVSIGPLTFEDEAVAASRTISVPTDGMMRPRYYGD